MVSSAISGRDTAKTVSVQCKNASKNVAANAADLITPHPSPKVTPSPQATQGKAMAKPLLRAVVLTASVDAANGTDKSVPYERPVGAAES